MKFPSLNADENIAWPFFNDDISCHIFCLDQFVGLALKGLFLRVFTKYFAHSHPYLTWALQTQIHSPVKLLIWSFLENQALTIFAKSFMLITPSWISVTTTGCVKHCIPNIWYSKHWCLVLIKLINFKLPAGTKKNH